MAFNTGTVTWADPSQAATDVQQNSVWTQTAVDNVTGNEYLLGGTTGRTAVRTRREWTKGADIVSANALALGTDGNLFNITGTTSITSFTSVPQPGAIFGLIFAGALTLTHGSNIKMLGAVNLVTAANTLVVFMVDPSNNCVEIGRYATGGGTPVVFQNSGDAGKKAQYSATPTAGPGGTGGTFDYLGSTAISFPATFGSTPVVVTSYSGTRNGACSNSVTTTGYTASGGGDHNGTSGGYTYIAIG